MSINKQIWATDIAQNLFPDNSFLMMSINDAQFSDGKKVWLPQAGAAPNVQRNRVVIPAAANPRVDTVASYDLDSFTSDPTSIRNIEEVETSYEKRQSVLFEHIEEIQKSIAEWMAYNWSPVTGSQIVRTTGADRSPFVPGGTGLRKKITIADILAGKRIL
jgi:hypothetical protein